MQDDTTTLKSLYKALKLAQKRVAELEAANKGPIAIIGAACRFPGGADTVAAYWDILERGVDAVLEAPKERWSAYEFYDPDPEAPGKAYSMKGGFLTSLIDSFDDEFFHLSPKEVRSMDPQQRLLLEVSWEALESAGIDVSTLKGSRTGVFCGIANSDYASAHLRSGDFKKIDSYSVTGIALSAAVARMSYLYGLEGPNIAIDTACSSSLVAVHLACRSLRTGESDMALVGGVNLMLTPEGHIGFSKLRALSPDGACKTFDAAANGYARGEGCGIIVLKRLSDALRDRDGVLAVVRGSGVNQDGRTNGFTAPSGRAQQKAILMALEDSGISPLDVGYVEAHGTGTPLGDPIEIEALGKVYGKNRDKMTPLIVGSVKANIGHLEAAAGIAGLIKALLVLQHGKIPPQIHFNTPNPLILWDQLPVKVPAIPISWERSSVARIAGVSSFGFSGTNAHIILQEAPAVEPGETCLERSHNILNLSAGSKDALVGLAARYAAYLEEKKSVPACTVGDICYSASTGRMHLPYRLSIVASSKEEMAGRLAAYAEGMVVSASCIAEEVKEGENKIVFMFTGQGSQYPKMGYDLYVSQPVFRKTLERCDELLRPHCDLGLLDLLYSETESLRIHETVYTQPVIFSIEYALAQLLLSWGIKPSAVLGHSIGEYVAACIAGVFSLEDALRLVAARGKLMQSLPRNGSMAVVIAGEEKVAEAIRGVEGRVSVAAINAPENIVISGERDAVEQVMSRFRDENIPSQILQISHAIHSRLMDPILETFYAAASDIRYVEPQMPVISNATGRPGGREMATARYWTDHIRGPVKFLDSMLTLDREGYNIFMEVGTTTTLTSLGMQCIPDNKGLWLPTLGINNFMFNMRPGRSEGRSDWDQMLKSLGSLYVNGVDIDWKAYDLPYNRKKTALPHYPFQRQRHWMQPVWGPTKGPSFLPVQSNEDIKTLPVVTCEEKIEFDTRPRRERLLAAVQGFMYQASEIELSIHDLDINLFELGFASLMLARVRDSIRRSFGLEIKMSWFFKKTETVNKLVDYLDENLPPDIEQEDAPKITAGLSAEAKLEVKGLAGGSFARIEALNQKPGDFVPYRRIMSREKLALNDRQEKHLNVLIQRFTKATARSKDQTQEYRPVFANIRNIAGFRPEWKEMIYQIIADRASGPRFWDIDGREYLDVSMGFGVYLFGHNPDFIRTALARELERGIPIGPMSDTAGRVAELIHKLTGVERVAFFNTGTEAVMSALRIARTVTERSKVVLFSGSFHGHFDGVLGARVDEGNGAITIPMAPGTPYGMVQDVYILKYGDTESLRFIEAHGHELAAVLVEPVQSRRPDFQPVEFLRSLRELTLASKTALIFDEVILGFRIHPGGAQALFNIQADIVTYGKVIGGGIPIGVVAGKTDYLDAIDGGMWQYGDASYPQKENTFIAGTFNHHPLAMSSAMAVLTHLTEAGPSLQEDLNRRTEALAGRVNGYFEGEGIPVKMAHFGSVFRLGLKGDQELLNYHLLEKGIYVWEGRNCFLSTAHTDNDCDYYVQAIKESVEEMRNGGLFSRRPERPAEARVVPMSSAQKRLYILSMMEGGEKSYHIPIAFYIDGHVDVPKAGLCFQELLKRHQSLRTCFEVRENEFLQKLTEQCDFSMDCRETTEDRVDELINDFIMPFDLSSAPLMRVCLAKISEERHLVVVDIHHIIFDGISGDILVREFMKLCDGAALPPQAAAYHDYVAREKEYLSSEEYIADREYWTGHLSVDMPALNLPLDFPRPARRMFRGKRLFRPIDSTKTAALKALSANTGASLFMVLLAAHYVLLHKLTGQEDFAVGTTFDARNEARFSNVIGMFVNTLAMRNRPSASKTFRMFLEEVKKNVLEAYDSQDYPFEHIVDGLGMQRDMSRNPVFDTMFVYERIETKAVAFGGLVCTKHEFSNAAAMFDLTQEILEIEGVLNVSIEFNTDILSPDTVERFLGYYENILDRIVGNADLMLSEIDMLPEKEKHQLLFEFNDTALEYPQDRTMADIFEEQVRRSPGDTALVFEDLELTYKELNERSNRVAHHLRNKCGVQAEDLVGMMFERSEQSIIGMLGILKAGAAFLPVDTAYPGERIVYMLEDSGCRLLLTEAKYAEASSFGDDVRVVDIRAIKSGKQSDPTRTVPSTGLAYVIYTSGTTGRPKGVMIEHRSFINMALDHIRAFGLTPEDRMLQFSSLSSDSSLFEIFLALYAGAALVLVNKETIFDTKKFAAYLQQKGVTAMFLPPVYLNSLQQREMKTVRLIITGGAPAVVNDALFYSRIKTYFNSYGPTETTVAMTYFKIDPDRRYDGHVVIGKPIANTQVLILDDSLSLLPIGVPGEICIAGDCLARGYLKRPELTAEKFAPHPFIEGQRIYRSGDIGRRLPDGMLECLGRKDDQVKIRGFRIELKEIEHYILQHPAVANALVTAKQLSLETKELVAYVVGREAVNIPELRSQLGRFLPDYMVPAYFVIVDKFPVTPNGKIDKNALPDPFESDNGRSATAYEAPRSSIEKVLTSIWEVVLGRSGIGTHDNFFGMGGDSIKAIQILSRLGQEGLKLEVRHLFEYPTIFETARKVSKTVRIPEQGAAAGKVPLTSIQSWLFNEHQNNTDHYTQAVLLRGRCGIEENALRAAFCKLLEHHDALRMLCRTVDGRIIQENTGPGRPASLEIVDIRGVEDAETICISHCAKVPEAINIAEGPLMKAVLFRMDGGDRLLLVIHHLVVDGVSWRIVIEDLIDGYRQYISKKTIVLPLKTDSFKLWAERMHVYCDSLEMLSEKAYWKSISASKKEPAQSEYAGERLQRDYSSLRCSLEERETTALLSKVNRAYNTEINDILLTALAIALEKWHGRTATLIDLEGHGREQIFEDLDISRTVGFFTAVYPFVLELPEADDMGFRIKSVKEALRKIPNKGIGYGILKYLTSPDNKRDMAFGIEPRISFNYLGRFDEYGNRDIFEIADGALTNTIGGDMEKHYDIEVEGMVLRGNLNLSVFYNRKAYEEGPVLEFLGLFKDKVLEVIEHCAERKLSETTPSDLTYKRLTMPGLEELLLAARIKNCDLKDIYPLSPLQEGMLFHALYDKASAAYFEQLSFAIAGDMDTTLFEESWNELFRRHDILRTSFLHKGADMPLQIVWRERKIEFNVHDLSSLIEEHRETAVREFKETDRKRPFDLSRDVLIRMTIFKAGEGLFEAVWSYHHILIDGWGSGTLLKQLFETYGSLIKGQKPVSKPASPYSEYIKWLEALDRQESKNYWADYLSGYEQPALLPRSGGNGNGKDFKSDILAFELEEYLSSGLSRFATRNQVTLNTLIQTVWGILLSKYSGLEDVVFGVTVSGRPADLPGVEDMIGLFINTIPVRIKVPQNLVFAEMIREMQKTSLRSEPYHYCSLADIQSAGPMKQGLLDHVLVFENYPLTEELYDIDKEFSTGFSVGKVEVFEQTNYDLTIVVTPGKRMAFELRYNARAFSSNWMQEMKKHLELTISAIVLRPEILVREIMCRLLDEEERNEQETFMDAVVNLSEDF